MRNFIVITLILLSIKINAQQFDLGSWNILNVRYKLNSKWDVNGEAQLRSLKFYNHFHYYEYKGWINYRFHENASAALGAGSYQTYAEGGDFVTPKNNDEFRLWPQLIFFENIGKLRIEHRYRSEFRFTSNGYRNRFRFRVGLSYPFGKMRESYQPFLIGFSNELFFTDREPYFERNRVAANFNYKPAKNITLMLGYLHQFDYRINDETGRDFLQVGLFFELHPKKSNDRYEINLQEN
jgi:long-subunit fatty acid transport protein